MVKQNVSKYKKKNGVVVNSYTRDKRKKLKSSNHKIRYSEYEKKYKRRVNKYGEWI